MSDEAQHTVTITDTREELAILGNRDRNLKRIREVFHVKISARGGVIRLSGEPRPVQQAANVIDKMRKHYQRERELANEDVERFILAARYRRSSPGRGGEYLVPPKTPGQERYLRAMEGNDVVFCIGPAGTGKTYLAVAMGLQLLRANEVRKIVLARPAVEAGEKLGFLPGDLQEKVNPFLRPLYDALQDMLDYTQFRRYMERDIIEVVPLAYMRGRTLNHSFVILDEAQNSTRMQMKMFLTRLGLGSKAVITGDVTQVDLPEGESSGLLEAREIFRGIRRLAFVYLDKSDVVRHKIVQDIVEAYERYERTLARGRGGGEPGGQQAEPEKETGLPAEPEEGKGDAGPSTREKYDAGM